MKISNFHKNKTIRYTLYALRRQVGFTLVELLVVMIVFVTVGSIIGSILFTTLRGTNKSNVLINVKQSGTTVMAQIEKTIRNARKFEGVSELGSTYKQNCATPLPIGTSPTSTPTTIQYKYLKVSSFPDPVTSDITVTTFSCTGSSAPYTLSVRSASTLPPSNLSPTPTPATMALLNNTVVSVNSCYFTCTQQNLADSPVLGVHFSVSQANTTANAENQAAISFDTEIAMRNYGR